MRPSFVSASPEPSAILDGRANHGHADPGSDAQGSAGPIGARIGPPVVERVAGWSASHRKTAVFGWLLLVACAVAVGQLLGVKNLPSYDPGQAGRAERILNEPAVVQRPSENVLIQAASAAATVANDPQLRRATRSVVTALSRLRGVVQGVRSPLGLGGRGLISADGRSALVTFTVAGDPDKADSTVVAAERAVARVQARYPSLRIAEAGPASLGAATSSIVGQDFRRAEVTSVPVTLVLLLLVFGALIAAGIPLLLAATAVTSAISLLAIPSRWLPVGSTTSSVVLLIGMAVGVDYSLFYLRRAREERGRGRGVAQAVRSAAATSGRAIVVSGLTVMISLAGLFLTGVDVFSGIALGAITVVGVAVIGSVTVLPALLAWLGRRVDRGRVPFLGRRQVVASQSRFWAGLVRRVVARPLAWGGAATILLLALAAPALGMRLADPGAGDLPANVAVVRNLLAIQRAFPGGPEPAEVVVTGRSLAGPSVRHALSALHAIAARGGAVREPITATLLGHGQVLLVSVPIDGGGTDARSYAALAALRDHVLPATFGRVGGVSYAVTGLTAGTHDLSGQLGARTPVVFAFVLGLAFLLLMIAFRSVVLPLLSIALNLLSVGAAYGLLTLIFQDGHLAGLLGFSPFGGIVPWLPLFLFVLLFGLSMDYHVFILSRVRELKDAGAATTDAVVGGISQSAGVVTSAAAIMVAVFSIFATLSIIEFKMFGVGTASAILVDATLVRGILLPAGMAMLGERTWYLPRWLRGGKPARVAAHPLP